ncbi:hypothetical protein DLAC_09231 [Tieghemostelium lacteum]|uniref:Uncharacterized protein n=1 Tax=Tieghemostelium lacteum TaxID=361077 RepID=A0A151Z9I5_TIELA|nr:hypothetical protein DLAC_09231 [Tieghemostelium lacteum]|eukprot:KYQ90602.1 hypothetical protein DLAC_09231 [Tieghemostelium lacteum]
MTPTKNENIQEQYVDLSLLKCNIWAKYQNDKFVVKQTHYNPDEGFIQVNTFNDTKDRIRKEIKLNEDEEEIYADFSVSRYYFDIDSEITVYVDCAFYEEIGEHALYGSVKTNSINYEKLLKFSQNYGNPKPVKSKIIHFLEISDDFKAINLPSTKNQFSAPDLISHDPFYFGFR